MKNYFSIGEAAKILGTTSETLRHYDRIGLVTPGKKDEWTNYRYYTKEDIVRLNTVRALQQMDLPLKEIKEVLEYNSLQKIVDYLAEAEKKADAKIEALKQSKAKIKLARADYEKKLSGRKNEDELYCKHIKKRAVLLSSELEAPSLDILWNYHRHFYDRMSNEEKGLFDFEDAAGIYTENGVSRMFAVCSRYKETEGLLILSEGEYLCADCSAENSKQVLEKVLKKAKDITGNEPHSFVRMIIVSGILQWEYQIQVFLNE